MTDLGGGEGVRGEVRSVGASVSIASFVFFFCGGGGGGSGGAVMALL